MRDGRREWLGWVVVVGLLAGCQGVGSTPPPALQAASRELAPLEAPALVKDIFLPTRSSSPSGFVTVGHTVYFSAGEDTHGRELWKSDGTREGTTLVKDLCPGTPSCNPRLFTRVGDSVFFMTGGEGPPGGSAPAYSLWKTDGSEAGTVRLKEWHVGRGDFTPVELTDVGGTLFFGVGQGAYAAELWKSDGTEEGTVRIKDLVPYRDYAPSAFRAVGGQLFFLTRTYGGRVGWWRSDGTETGTVRLQEFSPLEYAPAVGTPTAVGGWLLLPVNHPDGSRLWRSDGTVAGTGPVGPRFVGRWPELQWTRPVRVAGALLFLAWDEAHGLGLWRSDGTDAGTVLVKDLHTGGWESLEPSWLLSAGNTLYLEFQDRARYTYELWKSDGTEAGTVLLPEPTARPCCAYETTYAAVGDVLYVTQPTMLDATHSEELWRIDGTTGARRVVEFRHAEGDPQLYLGSPLDGRLVFAANDGRHGGELWLSDGTESGTRFVADLRTSTGDASLRELTPVGDLLFFSAREDDGPSRLWRSDGTEAGTTRVDPPLPEEAWFPQNLVRMRDALYFLAKDARGQAQLWKRDGTHAGPVRLSHFTEGLLGTLVHTDGALFFTRLGPRGWELWTSEGTGEEPRYLQILSLGGTRYEPPVLFARGDTLFWGAEGGSGFDLWKSDGTEAGTVPVKHFTSRWSSIGLPSSFVELGGTLVFRSVEQEANAWWKSDGTEAGTERLRDVDGAFISDVGEAVQVGDSTFFMAYGGGHAALWKTQGPALAARRVVTTDGALKLEQVNGTLFFIGKDEVHGFELWKSDGTVEGTRLVKDIYPGEKSSWPQHLTAVGGWLFLSADDGVHGQEVWVSDGTEAGTRLLADLYPGVASSGPSDFTLAGASLYFTAADSPHGKELWRLALPSGGIPPGDTPPVDEPPVDEPPVDEIPGSPPSPVPVPPEEVPEEVKGAPPPAEGVAEGEEAAPLEERRASGCGAAPGVPGGGVLLGLGWLGARRRARARAFERHAADMASSARRPTAARGRSCFVCFPWRRLGHFRLFRKNVVNLSKGMRLTRS